MRLASCSNLSTPNWFGYVIWVMLFSNVCKIDVYFGSLAMWLVHKIFKYGFICAKSANEHRRKLYHLGVFWVKMSYDILGFLSMFLIFFIVYRLE